MGSFTEKKSTTKPRGDNSVLLQNWKTSGEKQSHSEGKEIPFSNLGMGVSNFSKISILPSSSAQVQPKLKINSQNDKYEQEADKVAEQVVRTPKQTVQRKCAKCNKEEQTIQTKPQGNSGNVASSSLMSQIQNTQGGGRVMDSNTLSFMEPRFGMDFSGVRIHADNRAAGMSQGINAKAFTVGRDIFFNQGAYNPDAVDGKKLLAHELTHVVQQQVGDNRTIQRQNGDKEKKDSKKKEKVKTKVEVVTEHDFSKKETEAKASTTRSTEEEVAKGVTASASEKVAGDKTTNTAGLKAKNKASGLFVSSSIKVEDPTDPALANTHKGLIKVGGSWMLFNSNLKLGTSSSLEFAKDKTPKWSVDGSAVFFPNGVLSPEIAASFVHDSEGPSASLKPQLTFRIIESLSAKAGATFKLDSTGKVSSTVGAGIVFSF